MKESIYKAIRDLLKGDSTLQTLLGGQYVYIAHVAQTNQIPSITILAQSEKIKKRLSYSRFHARDAYPHVQIDCWSKKSRLETVQLMDRIDELLISDGITGTQSWERIGGGNDMFEQDTKIYHIPLHYLFHYKVMPDYFKLGIGKLGVNILS